MPWKVMRATDEDVTINSDTLFPSVERQTVYRDVEPVLIYSDRKDALEAAGKAAEKDGAYHTVEWVYGEDGQ